MQLLRGVTTYADMYYFEEEVIRQEARENAKRIREFLAENQVVE